MDYSDEQKQDITRRIEKANQTLKDLHLAPSVVPSWELVNGTYTLKLNQYLQDTLFTSIPSPIQP